MIPFLKKNKDGKKPPKSTVPRTVQESIPFQRMFEDGTCRVRPGYYTRTIQYQDINYQLAQQEDKTAIFEEWCSFLNFFDSSIHFELSFVNTATDSADFEKSIRIPYQQDGFDDVRAEYSQMLRQQLSKGNNGLTKTKFLTYGIEGDSMAQVKPRLEHIQNDLMNNFHRLGVLAKPPPGIEVTKGGATKGRETQKKMRLVKTSRIFFCKERLKPIFLPETKNSRPQGRPPPASPAKRVAGGKEEQQNERALTFRAKHKKSEQAI